MKNGIGYIERIGSTDGRLLMSSISEVDISSGFTLGVESGMILDVLSFPLEGGIHVGVQYDLIGGEIEDMFKVRSLSRVVISVLLFREGIDLERFERGELVFISDVKKGRGV